MSSFAFVNIALQGHVNPTLPVVAELVRRGHTVTYHVAPALAEVVAATGATVRTHPGGDLTLPERPTPLTMLDGLARTTVALLPALLDDLRRIGPDLVVHGSACPWGAVAAGELRVPAVSAFTTFAFGRRVPSPTRASWPMIASAAARPGAATGYLRSRWELHRAYDTGRLPLLDLANVRQPLNLVFTARAFQPDAESFDGSYRFVGPSLGERPRDPSFPMDELRDPVLYASPGTVLDAGPELLRTFAAALAPLGGTVVISTGRTDPAALGPLPQNVLARRFVPQLELLDRAALFVTHGGMNGVNEALHAGVPMLVIPQGADQPLVARRVAELGAGLALAPHEADAEAVRVRAGLLLGEPRFRVAAYDLRDAQRAAGGYRRAADELERHLGQGSRPVPANARGR
ncbi:macrolide family glycosyltransferase [Nonomuraea sp. NPDC049421]|uniref:macrolide family glycosyltransferase n=1 Tax=Nonomuraea sp. NPDC049421 TaxID=3155275 RepID=UPI0034378A7E